MRLSTSSALAALPLLAAAQDLEQYKAQFQSFVDNFGSYIPNPNRHDPVHAAETKAGPSKTDILTLSNWKETVYAPVSAQSTKPEEWWVFITGGNKTCFGHCGRVEAAFNQSAPQIAALPDAPHIGYIDCDAQPILCNACSAGAGSIWLFELLPEPAPVDIYMRRMNLSTVEPASFVELYKTREDKSQFTKKEGYFHPFDGELAKYGISVPVAYLLWGLSVVPSWAMMLGVSFLSRTMMSRRMAPPAGRAAGGAQAPPPRG
ncbi:unnamed protein product [Discula destructiva]